MAAVYNQHKIMDVAANIQSINYTPEEKRQA